jgi:uncharacterized protein YcbK (DUF882 family)
MQDLFDQNQIAADQLDSDRRGFLKFGLATTVALGFWTPDLSFAATVRKPREVKLLNVHTREKFSGVYWEGGRYIPGAFGEIKDVLRDYRTGERYPIDPRLIDILYVLQHRLDSANNYEVFSGYRSAKTNAMLARKSEGVARNSLHMSGQAIDLHLPGTRLSNLHKAAITLKSGGVGYYPKSDFVHIDTGRVRHWK